MLLVTKCDFEAVVGFDAAGLVLSALDARQLDILLFGANIGKWWIGFQFWMWVLTEKIPGQFPSVGQTSICSLVPFFLIFPLLRKIFHNISSHLIKLVIMLIIT